jgi:hypothetical protein
MDHEARAGEPGPRHFLKHHDVEQVIRAEAAKLLRHGAAEHPRVPGLAPELARHASVALPLRVERRDLDGDEPLHRSAEDLVLVAKQLSLDHVALSRSRGFPDSRTGSIGNTYTVRMCTIFELRGFVAYRQCLGAPTRPGGTNRGETNVADSVNRQVRLKSRPTGIPEAQHFEIAQSPLPELRDGEILVRNVFLSVEPAMRGWVSAVANYSEPVAIGAVMRSLATGRVAASRHPGFSEGEIVTGMFGWQDYAAVAASAIQRKVTDRDLPISTSLGVLGLNGLTAYFGLLEIGQARPGDTVVVSTAAGAVGSCVGQIAKIMGCRTTGIVGGATKAALCRDEFGYDAAIDYKGEDVAGALATACPEGVDVYFDNTAGPISDAVMGRLRIGARVVICGTASVASWDPPPLGPRVERHLLVKRARLQGFVIFDYASRYQEALPRLAEWIRSGRLRYREDILDGIEHAPGAIAGLYRGENLGKRLIRIAPDS